MQPAAICLVYFSATAGTDPYLELAVSSLLELPDNATVTKWPNTGSAAADVPAAVGNGTVLPVLRRGEDYPYVSLGLGVNNTHIVGNWFDFGSVPWSLRTNGGFSFVASIRFRGPALSWERFFDFSDKIMFYRYYGGTQFRFVHGGSEVQLYDMNDRWSVVGLRMNATSLSYFNDATNTTKTQAYNKPLEDIIARNNYVGKCTVFTPEGYLANLDIREAAWYDWPLTADELQVAASQLQAKFPPKQKV